MTYLKIRAFHPSWLKTPVWLVCNHTDKEFEPSGSCWPHLIRSEADGAEQSMHRYAAEIVRQFPELYEVVA